MSMRDRRASAVSPSLRFLGFIKQPDDAGAADQELELDEHDDELMVPPHEMAARRAAAAASVMEGAGRTLKGRDLRRMRNAVWRTTGFLDL
ncbi:unnamed protein product [Triticum turgidum subsp. durum]|uniref:Uncharacterized protein n=1 Tax=Triticum turgidum subsp. durum TaxID=4567 RepID=A0A9R1PUT6_TRITD|nr:unnamed protein product [Triticum turgidum subsp. durum]